MKDLKKWVKSKALAKCASIWLGRDAITGQPSCAVAFNTKPLGAAALPGFERKATKQTVLPCAGKTTLYYSIFTKTGAGDSARNHVGARKLQLRILGPDAMVKGLSIQRVGMSGVGHGFTKGVKETLQILAQIVVDRATSRAFSMASKTIRKALRCEAQGKVHLKSTSAVLANLRLRDLAGAPKTLRNALVVDVAALLGDHVGGAEKPLRVLADNLVRLLRTPEALTSGAQIAVLARSVAGLVVDEMRFGSKTFANLPQADKALALAGIAYFECVRLRAENPTLSMAKCPMLPILEGVAAKATGTLSLQKLALARRIVTQLQVAVSKDGSGRVRLLAAADALFTAAEMREPGKAKGLTLFRRLTNAALSGDGGALVTTAVEALASKLKIGGRGVRLLSALVGYLGTYQEKQGDDKAARAKRKEILESITQEMTDRSGRAGESIFSLGGSLRGLAGVRFGKAGESTEASFFGPVGLNLGFALQVPKGKKDWGLHIEVSFVDLGQFLAFNEEVEVEDPDGLEFLAPSLTVGAYWGHQMPFFVGATVGYSPRVNLGTGDDKSKHGSFTVGVAVGIYVPLLDVN